MDIIAKNQWYVKQKMDSIGRLGCRIRLKIVHVVKAEKKWKKRGKNN